MTDDVQPDDGTAADAAESDNVRPAEEKPEKPPDNGAEKEVPATSEPPGAASVRGEPGREASVASDSEPDGASSASKTRDDTEQEQEEVENLDFATVDERNQLLEDGLTAIGLDPNLVIGLARTSRRLGRTGRKIALGDGVAAETIVNTFQGAARGQSARSSRLDPDGLVALAHRYADNGQLATLRAELDRNKLVCLAGMEGTGRRATSYQTVAWARGTNNVYVIDLDEKANLSSVLDTDGVLHEDGGHVVELDPARKPPNQNVLAALSGRLSELNAVLIVICPPRTGPFGTIGAFAVEHKPPDPNDVLHRQLAAQLGVPDSDPTINTVKTEYIERCRGSLKIQDFMAKSPNLAEVVALANRLRETAASGRDPDDALSRLPSEQRKQAQDTLRRNEDEDDAAAVRRFSATTAGVAFAGSPPNVIFGAMELLSDILFPRSDGERRKQRVAFRVTDEPPVDGLTAAAALDVIWNDLRDNREPLLTWLDALSGDARESVRIRVGQLAGQLATYDFTQVYRALLRRWAESPRTARRQVAAWAIERALLDDATTGRARRQVTDWVLSRNQYLMDTAARVLATPHGASLIDDPWLYLWLVTVYLSGFETVSIAEAVTQLVREPNLREGCREMLDTLTEWLDDNEDQTWARVHIAKALLFAAQLADESDPNRAALLCCASENDDAWAKHLRLWLVALTEQSTTNGAFLGIRLWLMQADGNAELETTVTNFVNDLAERPGIRKRIVFNLRRWALEHNQIPIFQKIVNNF